MSSFNTEAFTLLGLGISIIGMRTVARVMKVGFREFKLDDYLMLVAAVIYSLETGTAYIVGAWWLGLANNGMTDEERKALDPTSQEAYLRRGGSKTQLIGWSLYTLLLWLLKLCMTIFYSRLTTGLYHLEMRVKIALVLIATTYIATESSILLGCRPLEKNWQIYPNPGNHCQPAISKIDLYVTVVLNVVTDIYLLSIPLPMLWQANLGVKTKWPLLLIFSGGIFVMMAGILRAAIILKNPVTGAQQAGSWAVRETFVAVVVGNVPMIYPMILRGLAQVSVFSRSNITSDKGSYQMNPTIGSERNRKRGKIRSMHALPTTMQQDGDSQEHIVVPTDDTKENGIRVTTKIQTHFSDTQSNSRIVQGQKNTGGGRVQGI